MEGREEKKMEPDRYSLTYVDQLGCVVVDNRDREPFLGIYKCTEPSRSLIVS